MYFIYKFYDKDGDLLYIGKTTDLKNRFLQHLKDQPWKDEACTVHYAMVQTKSDMDIYELHMINSLHPKYNKSLVNNDSPSFELQELNFFQCNVNQISGHKNKVDVKPKTIKPEPNIVDIYKPIEDIVNISNQMLNCLRTMSLLEQKLLLKAISIIQFNLNIGCTIKVCDFIKNLNMKDQSLYKASCNALDKLKTITINEKLLLSDNSYYSNGELFILFNEKLLTILYPKKPVLSLRLSEIIIFKTLNSLNVYWLLHDSLKDQTISYKQIKRDLNVIDEKYSNYSDLKKRIIEPSLKEINLKTSMNITYQEVKCGQKVHSIKFLVN